MKRTRKALSLLLVICMIVSMFAGLTITASAEGTVSSVTVDPATVSVAKGGTQSFTATVNGPDTPAQTVTWSLEGARSAATSLADDGALSIGIDETAATLIVRATSTEDTVVSGISTVTVTIPSGDSVVHTNFDFTGGISNNGMTYDGWWGYHENAYEGVPHYSWYQHITDYDDDHWENPDGSGYKITGGQLHGDLTSIMADIGINLGGNTQGSAYYETHLLVLHNFALSIESASVPAIKVPSNTVVLIINDATVHGGSIGLELGDSCIVLGDKLTITPAGAASTDASRYGVFAGDSLKVYNEIDAAAGAVNVTSTATEDVYSVGFQARSFMAYSGAKITGTGGDVTVGTGVTHGVYSAGVKALLTATVTEGTSGDYISGIGGDITGTAPSGTERAYSMGIDTGVFANNSDAAAVTGIGGASVGNSYGMYVYNSGNHSLYSGSNGALTATGGAADSMSYGVYAGSASFRGPTTITGANYGVYGYNNSNLGGTPTSSGNVSFGAWDGANADVAFNVSATNAAGGVGVWAGGAVMLDRRIYTKATITGATYGIYADSFKSNVDESLDTYHLPSLTANATAENGVAIYVKNDADLVGGHITANATGATSVGLESSDGDILIRGAHIKADGTAAAMQTVAGSILEKEAVTYVGTGFAVSESKKTIEQGGAAAVSVETQSYTPRLNLKGGAVNDPSVPMTVFDMLGVDADQDVYLGRKNLEIYPRFYETAPTADSFTFEWCDSTGNTTGATVYGTFSTPILQQDNADPLSFRTELKLNANAHNKVETVYFKVTSGSMTTGPIALNLTASETTLTSETFFPGKYGAYVHQTAGSIIVDLTDDGTSVEHTVSLRPNANIALNSTYNDTTGSNAAIGILTAAYGSSFPDKYENLTIENTDKSQGDATLTINPGTGPSSFGIYCKDLTVKSGVNLVINAPAAANKNNNYGIYATGNITVEQGATLTVVAGDIDSQENVCFSYGIYCKGTFTNNGTVTITAGDIVTDFTHTTYGFGDSCGLYAESVVNNGTLTAAGGNTTKGSSFGIRANGRLTVNSGTVNGVSGTYTGDEMASMAIVYGESRFAEGVAIQGKTTAADAYAEAAEAGATINVPSRPLADENTAKTVKYFAVGSTPAVDAKLSFAPVVNAEPAYRHLTKGATTALSYTVTAKNFAEAPTACTAEWCDIDGAASASAAGAFTYDGLTVTMTQSAAAAVGTYYFKIKIGDTYSSVLRIEVKESVSALNFTTTTPTDVSHTDWQWYLEETVVGDVTYPALTLVLNNFELDFTSDDPANAQQPGNTIIRPAISLPGNSTIYLIGTNSVTNNSYYAIEGVMPSGTTNDCIAFKGDGTLDAYGKINALSTNTNQFTFDVLGGVVTLTGGSAATDANVCLAAKGKAVAGSNALTASPVSLEGNFLTFGTNNKYVQLTYVSPITVDPCNGDDVTVLEADSDGAVDLPAAPTWAGHEFLGWYCVNGAGAVTLLTAGTTQVVTGNVYGLWKNTDGKLVRTEKLDVNLQAGDTANGYKGDAMYFTGTAAAPVLKAVDWSADITDSIEGWSWTAATKTLTLGGFELFCQDNERSALRIFAKSAANFVDYPGDEINIVLVGANNSVTTTSANHYAISGRNNYTYDNTDCKIIVSGTGTLNVVGERNFAINCSLQMDGGTLNVTGGVTNTVMNGGTLNLTKPAALATFTPLDAIERDGVALILHKGVVNIEGSGLRLQDLALGANVKFDVLPTVGYDEAAININAVGGLSQGDTYAYALAPSGIFTDDHGYWIKPHITVKATKNAESGTVYYGTDGLTFGAGYEYYSIRRGDDAESHITIEPGKEAFGDPAVATGAADGIYWTGGTEYKLTSGTKQNPTDFILYMNNVDLTVYNSYNAISFGSKLELVNTEFYTGGWETADYYTGDIELVSGSVNKIGLALPEGTTPDQMKISSAMNSPASIRGSGTLILLGGDAYNFSAGITMSDKPITIGSGVSVFTSSNNSFVKPSSESGEPGVFAVYNYEENDNVKITIEDGGELVGGGRFIGGSGYSGSGYIAAPDDYAVDVSDTVVPGDLKRLTLSDYKTTHATTFYKEYAHFFKDVAETVATTITLGTTDDAGNAAVKDMQAGGWFWDASENTLYLNACKLGGAASPVFSLPANAKLVVHSENEIVTTGANAITGTGVTVLNDNPGSLTVTAGTKAFTDANPTVEENAASVTETDGGKTVTIANASYPTITLVSGTSHGDITVKQSGGDGYYWDGSQNTLYLRNYTYESTDAVGMKITCECYISINGTNSITAIGSGEDSCGIQFTPGGTCTMNFLGDGTLYTGNTTATNGAGIQTEQKSSDGYGKINFYAGAAFCKVIAEGTKYGLWSAKSVVVTGDCELILRGGTRAAINLQSLTPAKGKSNTGTVAAPVYDGAAVYEDYTFKPATGSSEFCKDVRVIEAGVFTSVSGAIIAGKGGTTTVAVTTKGITAAVPQLVWCNSDGTTGGTAPTDITITGLPTAASIEFTLTATGDTDTAEGTYYLKVKIGEELSDLITISAIAIQKRTIVLDLNSPTDRNGKSYYADGSFLTNYEDANGDDIYDAPSEGWSWNRTDRILTLDGIDLEAVNSGASTKFAGGITFPSNDCTLVLAPASDNKVSVTTVDYGSGIVAAVYADGNLTIKGSGKLTAINGDSSAKTYVRANCGIYANGSLTIEGGTIVATGGTVKDAATHCSVGIGVRYYNAITISGGNVQAIGGAAGTNCKSYGAAGLNYQSNNLKLAMGAINPLTLSGGSTSLTGETQALYPVGTLSISAGAKMGCNIGANTGYADAVSVNSDDTFVEGADATGTTIAKDVKISYSFGLTYNKNTTEEITGTIPTDTTEYAADGTGVATVTVPTDLVRAGYDFKGWATTSGATAAEYTAAMSGDGLKLTMNESKTLYAVWAAKQITLDKTTDTAAGTYGTATTAAAPLYDLTALTVTNDGAGNRTYAVKEGSTLPAGLALTSGKVFGTPTQADTDGTAGTAVIFTVTGANGSKAEITVTFTIAKLAETAPAGLAVDYANEKLTGTTTAMEYRIGSTDEYTACTADMPLTDIIANAEKAVNVRTAASDDNHVASSDVAVTIKARPAAPTDLTVTKPTAKDASDGKLNGITTAMQYNTTSATATSWTTGTGNEITGIADGTTYYVRYAANETSGSEAFASSVATVKVQSKIDVTVSGVAMGAASYTYGGTAVSCTGTPKAVLTSDNTLDKTSDINSWTYLYTSTDDGGYSSDAAPTNAGAYKLTVTAEDDVYDGKQEITFTIAPKTLTAANLEYTGQAVTKVYDGGTACDLTEISVKTGVLAGADTLTISGAAVYNDADVKDATKVTFTPTAITTGNYALAATETVDIDAAITAKSITATVADISAKDYTGSKLEPTVTVKIGATTAELTLTTDYTVTYGENINAGDTAGSVTVTAAANGNYSFTEVEKNFKINKIDYAGTAITAEKSVVTNKAQTGLEVDLAAKLSDIAGAAISAAAEGTDASGIISNVAFTGKKVTFDAASIAAKDLTATINVTVSSTNYKDITAVITVTTVDKVELTITGVAMGAASYTYGGTAVSYNKTGLTVTGDTTPAFDKSTLEYKYSGTGTTVYDSTTAAPTAAGTYKLTVSVPDTDENYMGAQEAITFTIAKAQLTVSGTTAADKTYDGNADASITKGTVSGIVTGDSITVTPSGAFADKDVGNDKDVAITYAISGEGAANYLAPANETVKADITAATLTVTNSGTVAVTKTYDGKTDAGTLTGAPEFTGMVAGDDVSVKAAAGTYAADAVDAGTGKTVTLTLSLEGADKANYEVDDTYSFTGAAITKAAYTTPAITGEIKVMINKAASGTVTTANFTLPEGFKDAAIVSVTETADTHGFLTVTGTGYTIDKDKATTEGWAATCNVVISSKNYNNYTAVLTFTAIDKTELTISGVVMGAASYTYGGTAVSCNKTGLTVTGATTPAFDKSTLEYKYSGTGTTVYDASVTAPTAAGSYKLTVSVPDDSTVYMGKQEITFSIEKKPITVKLKDVSLATGAAVPTWELDLSGMTAADRTTYALQITTANAAVNSSGGITLKDSKGTAITAADAVKAAGTYTVTFGNMNAVKASMESEVSLLTSCYDVTYQQTSKLTVSAPSGGGMTEKPTATVIVDGKPQDIGEVTTTQNADGTENTTVVVDKAKLDTQIGSASVGSEVKVTIPETTGAATAQLVVKNVDEMAQKNIQLTVVSGDVTYTLRPETVDTKAVLKALGATDSADVPISVTIEKVSNTAAVKNTVEKAGATLIGTPVEFTVTATYNGKSTQVTSFTGFVSRDIEVTAEQAKQITTAIVTEADGSVRHVPTYVYTLGGKWYARINSCTNSTYALIFNQTAFADAQGRWYEAVVNEMASRKVISGKADGVFAGDSGITRAEFAAIIVRALGLPANGTASFSDVAASDWFCGAVGTAVKYGLVKGYEDGTFRPDAGITRQEAMALVHRAATLMEFAGTTGNLSAFSDADSISAWAADDASWNIGSGLIVGNGNGEICGGDNITRGETAAVVLRLLQKAQMVDVRTQA